MRVYEQPEDQGGRIGGGGAACGARAEEDWHHGPAAGKKRAISSHPRLSISCACVFVCLSLSQHLLNTFAPPPPSLSSQVDQRLEALENALAQEQQSSLKALQAILEHSQAAEQ